MIYDTYESDTAPESISVMMIFHIVTGKVQLARLLRPELIEIFVQTRWYTTFKTPPPKFLMTLAAHDSPPANAACFFVMIYKCGR